MPFELNIQQVPCLILGWLDFLSRSQSGATYQFKKRTTILLVPNWIKLKTAFPIFGQLITVQKITNLKPTILPKIEINAKNGLL